MFKFFVKYALFFAALLLIGCGEMHVYDVDTKFSEAIQVEPVSNYRKTVFLRIKDVTGYASELATSIEKQLKSEGYTIVMDPGSATFKLMVNVIKFGQGVSDDQITFMQAINPAKAAELAIEQNKVKTIRRSTNIYEKEKPAYFLNSPFDKRKKDVYADDEVVEVNTIRTFADRTAIADVEILSTSGRILKTRLMVGVNIRGGFMVAPTVEVDHFGWTRLIQRLSTAIGSMF
ncbi:MAG: hypothetical protein H6492_01430 [Candidatus Paracaedibacteraceae bacterium]|nr:hypothetical protein [Candidatus Paracaedibacteraceae bacterium]